MGTRAKALRPVSVWLEPWGRVPGHEAERKGRGFLRVVSKWKSFSFCSKRHQESLYDFKQKNEVFGFCLQVPILASAL